MVIPCLPNKIKDTSLSRQQQNRLSLMDDELHAFDLTWRNYLPSVSSFCCFKTNGHIRLDDEDPLVEPAYYNDHTLYRGEALNNNNSNWEFDSVLGQNDLPQFVTRNPFGTASSSIKKKKSHKKKKHSSNKRERPVVMETDLEESGDIIGYTVEQQEEEEAYYNDDAEFLGDDQIANLAYNRHSSQVTDQYGEELYYQHVQGPIIQEMQPPPSREFYAAKSMPVMHFEQEEDYDEYEERVVNISSSTTIKPQASIEAAQALLSERLDDLTEKLAFIKNNIIHIKPPSKEQETSDDECDRNTLHTIRKYTEEEQEETTVVEQNSDIDSITSEALNVYENTTTAYENSNSRRYSSGDELRIPSLINNTPFVSDQHPFTYFTDNNHNQEQENEEEENSLNVRNIVFDFGKKWLGV